jgi:hypothetical protein
MVLQVLIQYSPSVQLYGIGPDHGLFSAKQRTALSGFNDATPDNQSFTDKRSLIRSGSMSSSIISLATTLHSLFTSMERVFNAFERAQAILANLHFMSKGHDVGRRKRFEEYFEEAKEAAIKGRLTYAEVLTVLKEGLDSDNWPDDDAAVPFTPLKHNEPLPTIVEEHSRRADISAQMSLQYTLSRSAAQKRTRDQTTDDEEEGAGGDSTNNPDAKRRRKDMDSDMDEESATESANTHCGESYMTVYGGTESGEDI